MKKMLLIPLLLLVAASICPGAASAQLMGKADWMPDQGFWQVVSDPGNTQTVTVKFFGFHNRLIYEERLDASQVDPKKRKTRLALNQVLREVLVKASETDLEVLRDQGLVSARINRRK